MPLELDTRTIEWIGEQYAMYYDKFIGTPHRPSELGEEELKFRSARATLVDLRRILVEREEANGRS